MIDQPPSQWHLTVLPRFPLLSMGLQRLDRLYRGPFRGQTSLPTVYHIVLNNPGGITTGQASMARFPPLICVYMAFPSSAYHMRRAEPLSSFLERANSPVCHFLIPHSRGLGFDRQPSQFLLGPEGDSSRVTQDRTIGE